MQCLDIIIFSYLHNILYMYGYNKLYSLTTIGCIHTRALLHVFKAWEHTFSVPLDIQFSYLCQQTFDF